MSPKSLSNVRRINSANVKSFCFRLQTQIEFMRGKIFDHLRNGEFAKVDVPFEDDETRYFDDKANALHRANVALSHASVALIEAQVELMKSDKQ